MVTKVWLGDMFHSLKEFKKYVFLYFVQICFLYCFLSQQSKWPFVCRINAGKFYHLEQGSGMYNLSHLKKKNKNLSSGAL